MADDHPDPLLLGQRVVAILETGRRTATYKLALLMALIDHCIENIPTEPQNTLSVPIPALAHRVLDIYWLQVRTFGGRELVQARGSEGLIIRAAKTLRTASNAGQTAMALEVARLRAPDAYESSIETITLTLARQPLPRLQRLPGSATTETFLFDDSFLDYKVSRRRLSQHGDSIVLKPGVAHGLARLAGLLKPALEIMWVDDVRRMNKFVDERVPDVAGHLFGRERVSLEAVKQPFREAFGPYCFYCNARLSPGHPVDHVLPWSMVGIDGLANLVLACARCNGDKGGALPAVPLVDQVLDRDEHLLDTIAVELAWPTQRERVAAAARGLYVGNPGVPTWAGYRRNVRLDIAFPPDWRR